MYVSNLSFNIQEDDLRDLFAPYGEVSSVKVITDRETGRSRGFAFVEMSDDAAAQKAMGELNETSVDNRNIRVTEAKPREERSSGGGYGNNGYGQRNGGGGYKKSW